MGILIVIHRYLGVAVGLVMTLWCLSGFVMMYQSFPATTAEERLAGLEPLRFEACCSLDKAALADATVVTDFRIEMLDGAPILRLSTGDGRQIIDMRSGRPLAAISADQAAAAAADFARGRALSGALELQPAVELDQWTVQSARRHQPLYHFELEGRGGHEAYVSGVTGEVIQDTTARERFLGWIGAVPHWLYPTLLRENGKLWSQVVIWASVIGTFLTLTGLYVGVTRFLGAPKGRPSPFRGLWFWHHILGLFFGLLTLTWVVSGLISMNPWGYLEGRGSPAPEQYQGKVTWGQVRAFSSHLAGAQARGVEIRGAPMGSRLFAISTNVEGKPVRMNAEGALTPLTDHEVRAALAGLETPPASVERLSREDAFYYGHHGEVALPVYRAVLGDADATRLYIDAQTGEIARVIGRDERHSRWLQSGLHDFDFPVLRARPLWDLVVLPLLLGVTILCATGLWLSLRRLRRDFSGLAGLIRRTRAPTEETR